MTRVASNSHQVGVIVCAALAQRDDVVHLCGDPLHPLALWALAHVAIPLEDALSLATPRSATTPIPPRLVLYLVLSHSIGLGLGVTLREVRHFWIPDCRLPEPAGSSLAA